tara:strand:- start:656 stop:1105 length:450 start_codon:yes stop_codon:yes gene_type:complete
MLDTFHKDLKIGKITENSVLSIIKNKYPKSYIIDGYFKDYDIYVPEKNIGIEVKRDEKSKYTGNLVVEIEFDGKPSALSTTKADYWVFYDGECYIWITTSKLNYVVSNFGTIRKFIGKGDTKYKKAYLMKKDIIKSYADKITKPLESSG